MTTALSSSERAMQRLPPHLRRYVVAQDYDAYTPRDQAVWRHILRRLVRHLASRAHPSYLRGLEATGIGTERIPSMDEMNDKLARLGWSAVAVRGFIPPAVFTELQAQRVLAIAADIRTHEHVEYTPAPDIVHESAGHAPILADPAYAAFLRAAGELGFRAIGSVEDQEVYEAIRALSIVKEDPAAGAEEIAAAERRLEEASASRRFVSEATRASRLYWWTAEYGLVGTLDDPRIYGAGLLSSIGESTGDHGLEQARAARSVNHLVLADGTAVTGVVETLHAGAKPAGPGLGTALAVVRGPTLLSRDGRALGAPAEEPAVIAFGDARVPPEGSFCLAFASGVSVSGRVAGCVATELRASIGSRELEVPARAVLLATPSLPSVAGGAGDPGAWDWHFGTTARDEDGETRARAHKASALAPAVAALYAEVRALRESGRTDRARLAEVAREARRFPDEWLLRTELEELQGGVGGELAADAGR